MTNTTKGYVVRAIFIRDNGGGNLDVASPIAFVASDEGQSAVLSAYLAEEGAKRTGWRVIEPLCMEVDPGLMRAALGGGP